MRCLSYAVPQSGTKDGRSMGHAIFYWVKAAVERKSMREVLFESLKWYVTPVEITGASDKKNN